MLRALLESGFAPGLIVGTGVGALNGAAIAAEPTLAGVETLTEIGDHRRRPALCKGAAEYR
jgi:NTE family protein